MNPYAPPTAPVPASAAQAEVAVPVPGLEGRVSVRERSLLGRPGFVVDGTFRRSVRGVVEVADTSGRVHRLRLRGLPLDPCPRVEVDGVVVDVFPRLPAWMASLCMVPVL